MEKEDNKKIVKKKKKLKWYIKLLLIIIFITIYSFFIGTKGIFTTEFKVETNKIAQELHGLKILQFSDLHYGSTVNENFVKKLVKQINNAKPDVVIFTGDLINKDYKLEKEEKENIIKELSNIKVTLDKFYITGEEDFEEAESILNLSGFINLENKEQLIYGKSKTPILLISKNSIQNYFETNSSLPEFKILALHNPNDFNDYKKYNFDMVISGHTHNGQINIPKIKNLFIKSDFTKNHELINQTNLYVNPGIGTSLIGARLFNHPQIYLYRLNKTSK